MITYLSLVTFVPEILKITVCAPDYYFVHTLWEDVSQEATVGSRVDQKVNNAKGNVYTRVTPRTPNPCKSEGQTSSQLTYPNKAIP